MILCLMSSVLSVCSVISRCSWCSCVGSVVSSSSNACCAIFLTVCSFFGFITGFWRLCLAFKIVSVNIHVASSPVLVISAFQPSLFYSCDISPFSSVLSIPEFTCCCNCLPLVLVYFVLLFVSVCDGFVYLSLIYVLIYYGILTVICFMSYEILECRQVVLCVICCVFHLSMVGRVCTVVFVCLFLLARCHMCNW